MSNSKHSSAKFWLFAGIVLVASASGAACLWPNVKALAKTDSSQLTSEAKITNGGESWSDYQLATWLNSGNQIAFQGLASSQLQYDKPKSALVSLKMAGQGTSVLRLKIRALIESGQYNQAQLDATKLIASSAASQSDLMLAALANGLTDNKADIAAILPRLSAPEAVQAVSRAQAGKLPLAAQLYATGLLNSSSAILTKLPVNYERNMLLARINFQWGTQSDLTYATNLLNVTTNLDPASLPPRQLLVTIYRDQNKFTLAAHQQALINKINAGQP